LAVLLTDVDRLYSADRALSDAQPIELVSHMEQLTQMQVKTGDRGSQWGTGGMVTKVWRADRYRCRCRTVITKGGSLAISKKSCRRTLSLVEPQLQPSSARKRWIAHGLIAVGKLYLDQGAVTAICQAGKSLLAAGITAVEGVLQTGGCAVV